VAVYGETNQIIIPLHGRTSGRPVVQLGFELVQTNEDLPERFICGYLPKHQKHLDLQMINSAGIEVPKSTEGRALDGLKPLSPHTPSSITKRGDYFYTSFRKSIADASFHNFDFSKYFLITEPGDYKLMISQQLYFEDENFYLKSVALPKVTLNVKVVK
jgi:hypothetical protein